MPDPLATRLSDFATREDKVFCSLSHDLKGKKGFAEELELATGKSAGQFTSLWQAEIGRHTTASMAMMCVSRYENTGYAGYRDLIADAADLYLHALPPEDVDLWPMTLGHVISLELSAFRATTRGDYHLWAYELGLYAIKNFWGDSPLPKASLKTDHYESITGAGTLALALEDLWVSTAHVNGVLVPSNTINR